MATTSAVVEKVFRLFHECGDSDYIGEQVSKTQHSIQCGMQAERDGCSKEIILGAFLHDIGHLIGYDQKLDTMVTEGINYGAKDHDKIGAKFLKDLGFPDIVCDIVGGHVQAKRYLVYKHPEYYNKLTTASRKTLEHQGGPMTESEAKDFEASPLFDVILRMRKWDEGAKDVDAKMDSLEKFKILCQDVLNAK